MSDVQLHRVKRVDVKKLFGIYDHSIELNTDERVTIVHGPNGVGKTVMLRLIAALFAGRLVEFARLPFDSFIVELTDGTIIRLENKGESKRKHALGAVQVNLQGVTGERQFFTADFGRPESARMAMYLQTKAPWLDRVGEDHWLDERTGETLSTAEVLAELPDLGLKGTAVPEWFTEFRGRVSVHLIETQRLLRISWRGQTGARYRMAESAMVPAVREYARELQGRVTETLATYASRSQALDQSFPQRLLLSGPQQELTSDEIKQALRQLEGKRAELKDIGLLDDSASNPFDAAELDSLDPTQRRAMTLYVRDTEEKLAVLDDIARRIKLLRDTVNAKFKHKMLHFDRDGGFTAIGADGRPLDLDALSSGEQHELVLLYDLLFKVQPNTLVLIDEPELSLHVVWQKRFLADLLEIVATAGFDTLVATHSPFIVGDRSDLMVPLAAEVA